MAIVAGAVAAKFSRGTRREALAGWSAALLVPAVDFCIEAWAAHAGWWRLHGVGVVLGVPVIYPAGWIFFTFHFFMIYAAARRRVRAPAVLLAIFIPLGAGIGVLWNYIGIHRLGILTLIGGDMRGIACVWFSLVALGLLFFQALAGRGNEK